MCKRKQQDHSAKQMTQSRQPLITFENLMFFWAEWILSCAPVREIIFHPTPWWRKNDLVINLIKFATSKPWSNFVRMKFARQLTKETSFFSLWCFIIFNAWNLRFPSCTGKTWQQSTSRLSVPKTEEKTFDSAKLPRPNNSTQELELFPSAFWPELGPEAGRLVRTF